MPGQAGETLVVALGLRHPPRVMLLEPVELAERDAGVEVAQVQLVAGLEHVVGARSLLLVALPGVARQPVQAQRADARGEFVVAQREHAALARGEILVGVEAEARDVADGADLAAVGEPGLRRVRSILHETQPVPGARDLERGQIAGVPCVVHGHDGARARRDGRGDGRRVDAQRLGVDVAEDGPRAGADDDVGGSGPGQRRRDHLVAFPLADAERTQRQVHRGRAGGDRERHRGLGVERELALEAARERPGRQPAGLERAQHVRALLLAQGGRREVEPALAAHGLAAGNGGEIERDGHGRQDRGRTGRVLPRRPVGKNARMGAR